MIKFWCIRHDWVHRRRITTAPGPRRVEGTISTCRKCGKQEWREHE